MATRKSSSHFYKKCVFVQTLVKALSSGGSATVTLPATGTYTILVGDGVGFSYDGYNNQTGQYCLNFQGISASLVSGSHIEPGQYLTDEIEAIGDTDAFYFSAVQKDTVSITTATQKAYMYGFSPRWELYAPDGSLVKALSSGGSATATLPATGTYTILVGDGVGFSYDGYNNQTGQYGLSLQCIVCTKPPCEPENMTAEPKKVEVAIDSNAQETITITCKGGTPVEGELVTREIVKGAGNISISPENATTDAKGQAVFTITGIKKGKAKVEFKSGDLKVEIKVKVTK